MKEWQRWESMARDFASAGDLRREAECLEMALEILPPGLGEHKARIRGALEDARVRIIERGGDRADTDLGTDGTDVTSLTTLEETLAPEDAREAVMRALRQGCKTLEGVTEDDIVHDVVRTRELEEELVREALEDLVDEGKVYRNKPGRLMIDGIMDTEDIKTTVLAELGELSTAGRGGSRNDLVKHLTDRGFDREEVEEAIDALEEDGRLEEGHPGQLRPSLGKAEIEEVGDQIVAALEVLDPNDEGVLDARLERRLAERGWDLAEIVEAVEVLIDAGRLSRDGGEIRLVKDTDADRSAQTTILHVVEELWGPTRLPVPIVRALRIGRAKGLKASEAHVAIDELVDSGVLWKDGKGLHMTDPGGPTSEELHEVLLRAVRELDHGHQGATRTEVLDMAVGRGLVAVEAREGLNELIEEGLVHDTGGGLLRPG
jgi:hypothetical protein